jgi:hypothetical protein
LYRTGLPFSGDDWFITSKKLMITETTNEIFNMSLYEYLTVQTVPYWVRVQVANDASTAPEWHQLFQKVFWFSSFILGFFYCFFISKVQQWRIQQSVDGD